MAAQGDAAGLAALSICESLMIALVEKGILEVEEARSALEDAASAHQVLRSSHQDDPPHALAAELIERLITQMNAANPNGGNGQG
ncbi:hypothetical protein HL658_16050 [Azospirillum sp. RWY-5-1]|uniref:DUF1843 domain-containing protein n=1 Tax=Azospirillum oleiclasticum TaxID=2735135 RepID=A0ABX2TBX5_9PROT|nr:hypothetical protein [Azospirillum oleiclasticum]NYZ14068.1 hypothetical protein [Azospirillum oleiclasticum]NYZ21552.1 hypothetical protein [Azospirillum oleiclasticum]